MIPTIAALLLAPSTPEGQWGPTTLTPIALARKVDNALATLKGVTMHFVYVLDTTEDYGMKACDGTFVSPTVFRFEMPTFDPHLKDKVSYETWVADGRRFGRGRSLQGAFPKPQGPATQRPKGPAHPASVWFEDCSRVMLSGVGQTSHPVEGFVRDAKAQGFTLAVQTRHLPIGRRVHTWYRLVAAKGTLRCETDFDAAGYLPTNVYNTKGPRSSVRWYEGRWLKPKRLDTSRINFRQAKLTTKS